MNARLVSLQLDGTVSLIQFSDAVSAWNNLLQSIANEAEPETRAEILIRDLVFGSAIVSADVMLTSAEASMRFAERYRNVGLAVRDGNISHFPPPIRTPAQGLINVLRIDGGQSLTLSSDDMDILILSPQHPSVNQVSRAAKEHVESYGVITGRLQALSSRGSLRFTLYDLLNDRAIRCALSDQQRDQARELWDQVVEVEGIIRRDQASGVPLSIRQVQSIRPVKRTHSKERWMNARGVLRRIAPDVPSEVLIRQLRDA